jgi:nitrogen regulatory protein PII
MKMIVAIVQPQQLPDIKEALLAAGFDNLTCTNILGTVTIRGLTRSGEAY